MSKDWKKGKAEGEMKAWEEKRMKEAAELYKKKQEAKKAQEEDPKLKDIVSGLIVIDPNTFDKETGTVQIVHFCGYWHEITQDDIDALRKELAEDEEFGVTEIVERLEIIECPEEMLEYYRSQDPNE